MKIPRHFFLSRAANHTTILEINKRQKAHEVEDALESKTKIEAEEIQRNTITKAENIHAYPTMFSLLKASAELLETIAKIPIGVYALKLNGYRSRYGRGDEKHL